MKIYLSGSIRGGRELQSNYQVINDYLQENGYEILTPQVASPKVFEIETSMTDTDIFAQDISFLQECDIVIAEVSVPSTGVGYEIAYALSLNKPVLAVYEDGRVISAMITGNTSPNLTLYSYHSIPKLLFQMKHFLSSISTENP
ncbi:MAG: nucleoside 2-deoxyribosyltransferase [Candidatus Heimdallarchaeota archaeon]|nr:MAG: nucleoside 2-deoxyribosyltransferase [Candidatus Heimdallarchaeota archaeon]